MIHVCSLARLHATVAQTGARHVVTLLKDTDLVQRPGGIVSENHLILGMDDITGPLEGYVAPADEHVRRLLDFVRGWDRAAPLVMHCYAGISRSTAGAFVAACALNPQPRRGDHRPRAAPRLADRDAQLPHRRAGRSGARARRPHDQRDRADRPRRHGVRGRSVPARSGVSAATAPPMARGMIRHVRDPAHADRDRAHRRDRRRRRR